ncbi:MAG: serine protease [Pelagibacteraceae bacterium TMED247]|nr:MAG: serine protease [Pelagibacteraceae bacterium TMED247]|tara:strand:+ start:6406 stop:7164 length:759 start_codon:yes stop_codon:yes gene_type:complete
MKKRLSIIFALILFLPLLFLLNNFNKNAFNASSESSLSLNLEKETVALTSLESKIRNSAVKVVSVNGLGHGSGSYFKMGDKYIVITAQHVVGSDKRFLIKADGTEIVIGNVVFSDELNDIAVLVVPKLNSKKAMKFRPAKKEYDQYLGDDVFYSSFPSSHSMLSLRGRVVGVEASPRNSYIVNGYAWLGASGSGVFNDRGEYMGCLVAIDIGATPGGYQLVETIVWVSPISNIYLKKLRDNVEFYSSSIPEL